MWIVTHIELKIHKVFGTFQVFMCWIVVNILEQSVSKSDKKIVKRTIGVLTLSK